MILFKVNKFAQLYLHRSGVFVANFKHYITPFTNVFVVFEQVNIC